MEQYQHIIDLFREAASRGEHALLWAHVVCAQKALETWILKKEQK
jgi:hypothetical protein